MARIVGPAPAVGPFGVARVRWVQRVGWLPRLRRFVVAGLAVLALGFGAGPGLLVGAPAQAAEPVAYLCDGDPLLAEVHPGPVDAPGIPNTSAGTVPGAFVVLRWRGLQLQLPRSNASGEPTYTDGTWVWAAADSEHPTFSLVRGSRDDVSCRR